MNELACVILDYRRPQNMEEIIDAINHQSIATDVYIAHQENRRNYDGVCENIHLERNRGCKARYQILPLVNNPYTMIIDDDLRPAVVNIFEVMLEFAKKLDTRVGAYGLNLGRNPKQPYSSGTRIYHTVSPVPVDIILGNFQMINTRRGSRIWNENHNLIRDVTNDGEIIGCDDIILSYLYKREGKSDM